MTYRLGPEAMARLAIALPVGIGLVLVLWDLGGKQLWFDETFQAQLVSLPLTRFVRRVVTFEIFGAPYHFSLWLWKFLGTDEVALRLPSALFAVAALPVQFAIARRVLPTVWAGAAALLLAVNGMWVHYAQEARPYALWLLLASLATLALVRAVEQPTRRRWVVYAALLVVTGWTHLMTGFLLAAHALALWLHPDRRAWWRPAALAAAAGLAALVPIAVAIMTYNQVRWSWMGPVSGQTLWSGLNVLAGELRDGLLVAWLIAWALGGAVVLWRWWPDRRGAWVALLVLLWAIFSAVGPWAGSLVREMYAHRYLIAALPPLMLLGAIGLAALRPRVLGAALLGGLLVIGMTGVTDWYGRVERSDWRGATQLVVEQGSAADGLAFFTPRVFDGGALYQYRYYLRRLESDDRPTMLSLEPGDAPLEAKVERAVAGRDRLWAIGSDFQGADNERALRVIERDFAQVGRWPLAGLEVRLYERPARP